ncbi:MAG: hypothetical protein KY461_00395 [Actinobacteria bacterium]|nr:hypothetical protein [Actinomycetota bacterium]
MGSFRGRGSQLAVTATVTALALSACGGDDTTGDGGAAGAPVPGGGLTVSEARASELDGPITVTGFLIDDGTSTRLCEASLESYPPQCGEPSLLVEGITVVERDGAQQEGDIAWVDQASLTGEVEEGTLRVSDTVS